MMTKMKTKTNMKSGIENAVLGLIVVAALSLAACGSNSDAGGDGNDTHRGKGHESEPSKPKIAAVPVEVESVVRTPISEHIQGNGTLEAENEVDLVARIAGPITALLVEEGDTVVTGQLLASIDDREARNRVAIAAVARDEARLAFDRATSTAEKGLVSREAYDSAQSALEAAKAQLETATIQLAYTEIRSPFEALVVIRHIKQAQYVNPGSALFRISDFTPLLCPIEVPEKDLSRLHLDQAARIQVEAFPGETFQARVQRIRPTVDAETGTVTVTLEVDGRGVLRPGMFASIYLQTTTRDNALVIPRSALVLDSIGDTVYVRDGDVASRREVRLGIREEDVVEVVEGLREGEQIVVLGQEGLADGTPVTVLDDDVPFPNPDAPPNPERIEEIRARMRDRGMSEEQINDTINRVRGEGTP